MLSLVPASLRLCFSFRVTTLFPGVHRSWSKLCPLNKIKMTVNVKSAAVALPEILQMEVETRHLKMGQVSLEWLEAETKMPSGTK